MNGDGTVKTYHVVLSIGDSEGTVLDGFTISGGGKNNVTSAITVMSAIIQRHYGGGIFILNSSPTINNCTFSNNLSMYGAAAAINNSIPLFRNCIFDKNTAFQGGGLFINNCSPKFLNTVFNENLASSGGAMYIASGSGYPGRNTFAMPLLNNCLMVKNSATLEGGGIFCTAGSQYPITAVADLAASNCVFF